MRTPLSLWIVSAIALAMCALAPPSFAQQADRERIVDIANLSDAMQRATEPVDQRLRSSQLKERFEAVQALIGQPSLDKDRLIAALDDLEAELTTFTTDWDAVTGPLWEAQASVGQSIDRVRLLLARSTVGKRPEEVQRLMENYDRRLESLARAIQAEQDETRKERLKLIFANVLGLREISARVGSVNVGPAREAVYAKVVRALQGVEAQITATVFSMERAKIVLDGQREFVHAYSDILRGLVDAERLVDILRGMENSNVDFAGLVRDLGSIAEQGEEFALAMDEFAGTLASQIEEDTARLAADLESQTVTAGVDVDAAVAEYASRSQQPSNTPDN